MAPQDSKSLRTQYKGENKPPPCSLHYGRKVKPLLAQACPPCWMGPVPLGSRQPRAGEPLRHSRSKQQSPGERPAAATCPASLLLRSFCWENCKTEVALLRCTWTKGTCCFSQCRGMQRVPPRAQGSSTCSRRAGHPYPMQLPFPSSGTCSKGKAQPRYFTFLLEKNPNNKTTTHHHNKLSYLD